MSVSIRLAAQCLERQLTNLQAYWLTSQSFAFSQYPPKHSLAACQMGRRRPQSICWLHFTAGSVDLMDPFQVTTKQRGQSPFFGHEVCDWMGVLAERRRSTRLRYELGQIHVKRRLGPRVHYVLGVCAQAVADSDSSCHSSQMAHTFGKGSRTTPVGMCNKPCCH